MAFTHTPGYVYKTDVGQVANVSKAYVGNEENDFDGTVAASTTNQTETLVVTVANIQSLLLLSDQALTIKTNSATSPQDTITLKANVPIIWNTDSWDAKPFSGNVTNLFLTNGGSTLANVKIRILTQQ
jgi:hypothetical protein